MDKILIRGLRVYAYHGVKAEEKEKGQPFLLDIDMAADTRAAEIINKANQDAATIRSDAQSKIADLTSQLTALRKQTSEYYDSLKKITDAQTASMEQIKRLL